MTERRALLKNSMLLKQRFKCTQLPPEIYNPSKLRFGNQLGCIDPFEKYQMPSFGIPAPINRIILNPFDQNWSDKIIQVLGLQSRSYLDFGGVQINDLYTSVGEINKLRDLKFVEDSPRGPHLEILMNYLENLAEFHGIEMPKFKLYKEEHMPLDSEDLNPVGGSSFTVPITKDDLPTFKLYGRGWYIKNYITQVQDWLDLFAKELGFTAGYSLPSWIPRTILVGVDNYAAQTFNKDFKEGIEDPNTRGSSWTPKDRTSIGNKGKLYRNEHHRLFPNEMGTANYPIPIYVEGAMHLAAPHDGPGLLGEKVVYTGPAPHDSTLGGFIKEGDDYWWYSTDPFVFTQYKYKIQNVGFPLVGGPINPTLGTGLTARGSNIYSYQFPTGSVGSFVVPSGKQTLNAGVSNYATHRIFIFKTGGDLKRRYGITSSNPKCLFTYFLRSNPGAYFPSRLPEHPSDRTLTAVSRMFGRYPFKSIKITCGKLNNIGGFYPSPYPGATVIPASDPWQNFQIDPIPPIYSNKFYPYKQTHANIINQISGEIDGGSNSTILELGCSDIPFTNCEYGPTIEFGPPTIVVDVQYTEQILDMSPLFEQSGDYVYICLSYHDFFTEVTAHNTYEMYDIYNAFGRGIDNADPLRNQLTTDAFSGSYSESFNQPQPYSTYNAYRIAKVNDLTIPGGNYWNIGKPNIDIVFNNSFDVNPTWPTHVDRLVYR